MNFYLAVNEENEDGNEKLVEFYIFCYLSQQIRLRQTEDMGLFRFAKLDNFLDDAGMVWPPYPAESRSRNRSGKSLSHFKFNSLDRGKLWVRFAKCESQKSNEKH